MVLSAGADCVPQLAETFKRQEWANVRIGPQALA